MKHLSIIGAGRLGQTLGHLFHKQGSVAIAGIHNRSASSSLVAAEFIGTGQIIDQMNNLPPSDYFLIACPDDSIEATCEGLAGTGIINDETIVFHCSGAKSSDCLHAARNSGAAVASVHPIKSFSTPARSTHTFSGTFCTIEGDERAVTALSQLLTAIGGRIIPIHSDQKSLYHAAICLVCNHLVGLMESGLQLLEQTGIERNDAMAMIQPIVHHTVDNIFTQGTTDALTGPIVRGDASTIAEHIRALGDHAPKSLDVYRALGECVLDISKRREPLDYSSIETLLATSNP